MLNPTMAILDAIKRAGMDGATTTSVFSPAQLQALAVAGVDEAEKSPAKSQAPANGDNHVRIKLRLRTG